MVGSMVGSMVNTYLHTLDAHMLVPSCQRRTHPSMIQTRRSTGRLSVPSQLCCFVCGFPLAAVLERALLLSPGPIGYIHTREVKNSTIPERTNQTSGSEAGSCRTVDFYAISCLILEYLATAQPDAFPRTGRKHCVSH
jgi:hypothetical protein